MALNTMEQLTPRHFEIIDLAIQGLKSGEIAKRMKLTLPYVSTIMGAPNFQHQLAMRRERYVDKLDDKIINSTVEAGNVLKENAVKAANTMVALLDNGSAPIQRQAAAEVLDRAGVQKQNPSTLIERQTVVIDEKSAKIITETLKIEQGSLTS